jgi:hypothetical protein
MKGLKERMRKSENRIERGEIEQLKERDAVPLHVSDFNYFFYLLLFLLLTDDGPHSSQEVGDR